MFSESFGPEFAAAVDGARDLFVTGMARNAFVMSHYNLLERKLRAGASMRFLLVDPESRAIEVAADRYYVERSAASARERVLHTLRLLTQLQTSTQGSLSVRLTGHPLAMGVVAADSGPDGEVPAVFAEYYSYQTPGDPKFVLQPGNTFGYDVFLNEAEALWESAKPHELE